MLLATSQLELARLKLDVRALVACQRPTLLLDTTRTTRALQTKPSTLQHTGLNRRITTVTC
jgi:hypothetical protein